MTPYQQIVAAQDAVGGDTLHFETQAQYEKWRSQQRDVR